MKKFDIIYESVLNKILKEGRNTFDDADRIELKYIKGTNKILKEGGNAFDDVDRIELKYIKETIEDFRKNIIDDFLGFKSGDDLFTLGSTGKKPDSGDIDLCLNANILKDSELVSLMKIDELCAEKGFRSYINTINFKMLHISYPQAGNDKNVQIDLLITPYPDFAKFFMFSPTPNESRYKGAHRNALFHAIFEYNTIKYINVVKDKPLKWSQTDISDDGIFKVYKTLVDDNGNILTYKNTSEPLEFSYAKVFLQIPISRSVKDAVEMMFGSGYSESDLCSFEQVFNIILHDKKFKFSKKSEEILHIAAIRLKEAENRLEFPKELEPYLIV